MSLLQKVDLEYVSKRYLALPEGAEVGPVCIKVYPTYIEKVKQGVVEIGMGEIDISNYLLSVVVNPRLYQLGEVSAPSLLEPGDHDAKVVVRTFSQKDIELADLEYLVNLYVHNTKLFKEITNVR